MPRQHRSGGKDTLLGISKRGDRYVRSLLVHGARAVVSRAEHQDDRLSLWINTIRENRGFNKAVVALINKMVRMGWAVLANKTVYRAVSVRTENEDQQEVTCRRWRRFCHP